jgi:hypothetical protein
MTVVLKQNSAQDLIDVSGIKPHSDTTQSGYAKALTPHHSLFTTLPSQISPKFLQPARPIWIFTELSSQQKTCI